MRPCRSGWSWRRPPTQDGKRRGAFGRVDLPLGEPFGELLRLRRSGLRLLHRASLQLTGRYSRMMPATSKPQKAAISMIINTYPRPSVW